MVTIEIDVVSDFVCVWCYIGMRKLEKAISLYQETYPGGSRDQFSITYRPYYLNNNPCPESIDKREFLENTLGADQIEPLSQQITQIGLPVGISFKFGGKIGHTRDAHRLARLGQTKSLEVQNGIVKRLFQAYHELEKDISCRNVLCEIGVDAGLEVSEIDECLNSTIEETKVNEEAQKYRELLGSGVPAYIIQGVHRIDGAQDPLEFMEIFAKVRKDELAI